MPIVGCWIVWLLLAAALPTPQQSLDERSFLILDLEGDGLYLADAGYPVPFDVDGDGVRELTAWTAGGRDEAFLWIDRNENAVVDGGGELFGSQLGLDRSSQPAFRKLVALDRPDQGGNGDGVLSSLDSAWSDLRLWIDRDHDGRSAAKEQATLADRQILAIALDFREFLLLDGSANWIRAEGEFRVAGSERTRRVLEVEFTPPR